MTVHVGGLGVDEDWSKVDPQEAVNAGAEFVIGYVSQDNTGKNLTSVDVQRLHAVGLAVGLVYEYNPQSALGGYNQGVRDANIAVAHAQALGAPLGVALYTAVDWNVLSVQMSTALGYANGFLVTCMQAGYRSGVYGGYPLCAYLQSKGYSGFLWQTYAWSNGQWLPGVAVHQYENGVSFAGGVIDLDEAETIDFGLWESELVALSDNDIQRIKVAICGGNDGLTTDNVQQFLGDGVDGRTNPPTPIGDRPSLKLVLDKVAALQSTVDALAAVVRDVNGTLHVSGDITVS